MRRLPPLVLVAACALVVTPARADERAEKLGKGEILVESFPFAGSDTQGILVTAVIDSPVAVVWGLVDRCGEYKQFMPRMADSEELSRDGNIVRCRTVVDSPWPVSDLSAITRAELVVTDGKFVRQWKLESGDYKTITGSWTLTPFEGQAGRTLAVYSIHTEPKTGVPGFIRDFAQKSALPDVIKALRVEAKKREGAPAAK